MPRFATLLWLLLVVGGTRQDVVLEAPDARIVQRLESAKAALDAPQECTSAASCDDVAINALALTYLGRFEQVRRILAGVQHRTPLWLVAVHQYWLASGDNAFVREQWWSMQNIVSAEPAPRPIRDGGVLLAALDGLLQFARVMNDSTTLERARSMYKAAEQRAQEHPGVIAPAFGLLNAELADAHVSLLVDTVHKRWPIATGLVAQGLYEYHRAPAGFALLQQMSRAEDSAPAMFVIPLLRGLIGWETDARQRAIALEPHLPSNWNRLAVSNLRLGSEDIGMQIRREEGTYSISITRSRQGSPISLTVAPAFPRGTRVRSVRLNDQDVATHVESNARDVHVVIEAALREEVHIEIEYEAPRASER